MLVLKRIALGLLGLLIVLSIIFIVLLAPKNKESTEKVDFVVAANQRSAEISQNLEKSGVIKNGFSFYLYLKLINGKILPGTYELSASQSASDIAGQLASGRFKVAKITIIEGWRASQMEDYLVKEKNLTQLVGFTKLAQPDEGYLFPDTYEVKIDVTSAELIKLMRETFDKKTKDLRITPETVILASIVEREAQGEEDRSLIAGVYANRVKQGIRLEADPTIQYAKGNWAAVTLAEYKSIISPYNTYLNDSWPPGPICSPGLKSLEAAAKPATHDYIYFFHAKGQTYFSKTYAEHQAKVRQYF
ncbi:MAG: endolytic transglycosylase MltG [Candidatus Berkelbacteria bacterium]|nr:endolytic transglycosylase MltG [Candidatus Berkelbacteria bacterium]MCR4307805.1 endolytic transglycosylase MltG [Candidatus Berkelbacteria bacterium]